MTILGNLSLKYRSSRFSVETGVDVDTRVLAELSSMSVYCFYKSVVLFINLSFQLNPVL